MPLIRERLLEPQAYYESQDLVLAGKGRLVHHPLHVRPCRCSRRSSTGAPVVFAEQAAQTAGPKGASVAKERA
ncbi:hypothetical protein [Variovorax sp. OV329]|uniref:hypothetical protein n=1 Tax=Variovorax sp. OV329 TaxID=1882825 RepID=UPI0008EE4074|nr:hypothetical protein [Variovorax sp. OV329]SFM91854.1 hypothetical protein SAMN05444747_11123 [Variovorax sp. OV329]